ncbi:MAG: hypothetical protein ACKOT0_11805 [bacterium]
MSARPALAWAVGVLCAAAALVVLSPLALLGALWVGPQAVVAGLRAASPAYAVAGLAIVLGQLLVVVLLASLPGVWRAGRRAAVTALVIVILLLLLSLTAGWTTVVAPWCPRLLAIAVLSAAAISLVVLLARHRSNGGARAPYVGLVATGVVAAYCAVAVVVALGSTGIPSFPRLPGQPEWVQGVVGSSAVGALAPPQSPALAPGEHSGIHNDAWMTDAYTRTAMADARSAQVRSFFAGGDCASMAWDDLGRIVAVCVSPTQTRAYVLDPRTLEPVAERRLAERPLTPGFLTDFSGGGYAVLDSAQRLVTPLPGAVIARYDVRADLAPIDAFPVGDSLQEGERLTSVLPDWGGALWLVGQRGTVGVLDPASGAHSALVLTDGAGRPVDIENSFASAEGGGAYVVTSADLVRLDIADGRPVVTWQQPYDRGVRRKPGQTSRASGTTPTVFAGGRYVAITDNAEPRMNLVVVDMSGPSPRVHCEVPVFAPDASATDNSIISMGNALFVENNYDYSVLSVAGGRTSQPGLARIDVTDDGCTTGWETTEVTIPSLVSKGVAPDGAILTYTKESSLAGVDAWWFTAVDATTGKVLWRRLAGNGPLLNNHYAAGYVGPDGSVYVGTISGVVALVRDGSAGGE